MRLIQYFFKDVKQFLHLARTHSLILAIVLLSYLASYGLNFYLAQILDPQNYGDVSVVWQVLLFATPVALLGTELAVMRFLPMYMEQGKVGLIAGFLKWMKRTYIISSLVILGVGLLVLLVFVVFSKTHIHFFDQFHIIITAFWLVPLFSLVMLLAQVFQAMKKYYHSALFSGLAFTLLIIVTVALLITIFESTWIGLYRASFSVLLCIGVACVIMIMCEFYWLKKCMPKRYFTVKPQFEVKRWSKVAFEMMSSTVVFGGLLAIDIVMLEVLGKNEAQVGHFAAVLVIASSIGVFGSAVDMLVNPMISPCIEQKNHRHLQSVIHIMNLFKAFPALLLTTGIIIFGKDLLRMFGDSYVNAYSSLVIVVIGVFWGICLSSSGPLLLYSGHQRTNFKLSIIQLGFIIVLDVIFIPLYHIQGAAIVLTVAIILSAIVRAFLARKYLGIHTFYLI